MVKQQISGGTYLWIAGMVRTESLSSPADHCIQTNTLGSRGAFFEGIGFQWEWPAKKMVRCTYHGKGVNTNYLYLYIVASQAYWN